MAIKYGFELDDEITLQEKGDISFLVVMKRGEPNKVRAALDEITGKRVGYANYLKNVNMLNCYSDQETLREVFQWDLEFREMDGNGAVYEPKNKPTIPKELSDLVFGLGLGNIKYVGKKRAD